MLDALAFLPVQDVPLGMDHLKTLYIQHTAEIIDYFDSTYVSGRFQNNVRNELNIIRRTPARFPPQEWNVNETTLNNGQRTNNQCEGWNNRFTHLVGHQHPHIWKLIKFLKLEKRTNVGKNAIGKNVRGKIAIGKNDRPSLYL